jgi:hypothetical protein
MTREQIIFTTEPTEKFINSAGFLCVLCVFSERSERVVKTVFSIREFLQ